MSKKIAGVLIIIILVIVGYLVFAKQGLQTYHSEELGLSFDYPADLTVYQQDENNILIKADYGNPEHSAVSIDMVIKKINSELETRDQIDFRLQGKKILNEEAKNGYSVLRWGDGSQYYILSDKGTFYVGDTLDMFGWKEIFEREGLYETYREKFDMIRESIRFE